MGLSEEVTLPRVPANLRNMMATFSLNVMKKTTDAMPYEKDGRTLTMSNQSLVTAIALSQSREGANFSDPVLGISQREHDTLRSIAVSNVCLPYADKKEHAGVQRKHVWSFFCH